MSSKWVIDTISVIDDNPNKGIIPYRRRVFETLDAAKSAWGKTPEAVPPFQHFLVLLDQYEDGQPRSTTYDSK